MPTKIKPHKTNTSKHHLQTTANTRKIASHIVEQILANIDSEDEFDNVITRINKLTQVTQRICNIIKTLIPI